MCSEVSGFGQWLDHFLPVTAGHSSHTLPLLCLAGMSSVANRRLQILFPKNVLTKNVLEIVMSVGVKCEIGQEADRNGDEGSMSAQRRIPSLCKQKTHNQGQKEKFSHCGYKHFTGLICCIGYSGDFGIELIYQIASSLLFVRSLGTINEGD